jgi:hypothetical protein
MYFQRTDKITLGTGDAKSVNEATHPPEMRAYGRRRSTLPRLSVAAAAADHLSAKDCRILP